MITTEMELRKRVLAAVRDYGVELSHFRNAMSAWAGLNPTDMECLRYLFAARVSTPSELARFTGLTSGATTAMLDRLEKGGWIERKPNPEDRRGTLIIPAETSQERAAGWFASARKAQEVLVSSYQAQDLEIIEEVFERFTQLWRDERRKIQPEGLDQSKESPVL